MGFNVFRCAEFFSINLKIERRWMTRESFDNVIKYRLMSRERAELFRCFLIEVDDMIWELNEAKNFRGKIVKNFDWNLTSLWWKYLIEYSSRFSFGKFDWKIFWEFVEIFIEIFGEFSLKFSLDFPHFSTKLRSIFVRFFATFYFEFPINFPWN